MNLASSFCIIICISLAGPAFAQAPGAPSNQIQKYLDEANRRVSQVIRTDSFQKKMPFVKFLHKLNQSLQTDPKIKIRFDREAFGKEADKMLQASVELPPVPGRMPISTALRLALSQASDAKQAIEFTAGPGELIITTRDRSFFTATYDIRKLLQNARILHELFKQSDDRANSLDQPAFDRNANPAHPEQWLLRQLISITSADRARWGNRTPTITMEVVNGSKLVVRTIPSVHSELSAYLFSLGRLADNMVVMDASLYGLDRSNYETHFAPLFVDPKDKSARRFVIKANDTQVKELRRQKPILTNESEKVRPYARSVFLSRQNAFQFQARPGDEKPTIAFEGITFSVRPALSPDLRCIRLELFHDVAQLIKLTKGTMVDMKTGKEVPVELPNVRKSTASATIEIHDRQPILLAVDYRPKDGKVWLVLVEPRIYIEEEEEQIRIGALPKMRLADEKPMPELPVEDTPEPVVKPPVPLPDSDDVKQILQRVVESVMTDTEIKKIHSHYGMPNDQRFTLIQGSSITWPKSFRPSVPGYTYVILSPDECSGFKKRLLGIRLENFNLAHEKGNAKQASIEIVIDDAIHGALGACHIDFDATFTDNRWKVSWSQLYTR